ncbi:hypothetical protein [Glycomyces terrestris]|uniref:Uncharacterized protein n=1 Tax=Glycomyces terrestris TaxID=2493553 RepID=A0A426V3Q3_9ACTN|nr:hypothetical protein [Glycomyces terrestris]RRS01533.1 hypothetical protein EIW28_01830 [Glycomyces terrestris]
MDPTDFQIERALMRSSAAEFALTVATCLVIVLGLAGIAVADGRAVLVLLCATITAAALLFGASAMLRLSRARLLLAWRRDSRWDPPDSGPGARDPGPRGSEGPGGVSRPSA